MAFDSIKPLEKAQFYLDTAFKRATLRTKQKKLKVKGTLEKIKAIETNKLTIAKDTIYSKLSNILQQFPNPYELNPYYYELLKTTVGVDKYRQTLKSISFAQKKTNELYQLYEPMIRKAKDNAHINKSKRQFYARVSSVMKSVDKDLLYLREVRDILRSFPTIRERLMKVAIAGFPNVGKSTLLGKITESKPETNSYAFTTRKVMIGYMEEDGHKIVQLLDTPGTLNRIDKMNHIEKQAYLAMQMVSDIIVYVFDPMCEYPFPDQLKLYERVKEFGFPTYIYISKTDIAEKKDVKMIKDMFKDAITSEDKLKKIILKENKKYIKEHSENV